MIHVGIDLHRDSCRLKALDDLSGEILLDDVLPAEPEALRNCLRPFQERGPLRLAMESCGFAGFWADVLEPLGDVAVFHARAVASRRTHRRKHDRGDAHLLMELSVENKLRRCYLGTTTERDWKDLLRYRVGLVRVGTRLRVRLRNLAQRYGMRLAASDVDSTKGRALWAQFPLRAEHRLIAEQLLALLAEVERHREAVDVQIAERAPHCAPARTVELLDTLPGVGWFGALLIAAEVGDWQRFPRAASVACYAGLVPVEDSSGNRVHRGPVTKEGSSYLRWIMVQAALKHACSPRLEALYQRIAQRRGPMKARVAVARELLEIAWHLIRTDTPYEERLPRPSAPAGREARELQPPGAAARDGAPRHTARPHRTDRSPAAATGAVDDAGQLAGPQTC